MAAIKAVCKMRGDLDLRRDSGCGIGRGADACEGFSMINHYILPEKFRVGQVNLESFCKLFDILKSLKLRMKTKIWLDVPPLEKYDQKKHHWRLQ
jgi:hypothetical protein